MSDDKDPAWRCYHTEHPVCPYCAHVHRDSWEFSDDGDTDCNACGRRFLFTAYAYRTFTTTAVPPDNKRETQHD